MLVLAVIWAACVALPSVTLGQGVVVPGSPDAASTSSMNWTQLVTTPAGIYGLQQKQGYPKCLSVNETLDDWHYVDWMEAQIFGRPVPKELPHVNNSRPCPYFINHHFKVIFIKTPKTGGSSTIRHAPFRGICKGGLKEDKMFCFEKEDQPLPEHVWMSYFVFIVVRNPWARAASMYHYLLGLRQPDHGSRCRDPSFHEFCADPTSLAKQTAMWRCSTESAAHDFYHVEPAGRCAVTSTGGLALDYIVRMEHIHEDLGLMVGHMNARGVHEPVLVPESMTWAQKGPMTKKGSTFDVYGQMYERCNGVCARNVAAFYEHDIGVFGFGAEVETADAHVEAADSDVEAVATNVEAADAAAVHGVDVAGMLKSFMGIPLS